ncbi:MAG: NAD-dependent epimerase/dehydratase family protein [bacterium]|nr:NAD-dependent epimerase/dehydratase family protein [bacterium]
MEETTAKPKILVTGGAGFIGSHLVDHLIEQGYPVIVLDNLYAGRPSYINPVVLKEEHGSRFYQMDIRDHELHRVFDLEKPDYVFHFAGQIDLRLSVLDPIHDIDINIIGGVNLLKNCIYGGVKKIIFASSGGAIYGELPPGVEKFPHNYTQAPVSPYGHSKVVFERHLEYSNDAYGIDYVALRFANVYGPRQETSRECGVISIFVQNFLNKQESIINGDGSYTRDFVYVADCVDSCMRALNTNVNGVYNVSTGIRTSINELFNVIVRVSGNHQEPMYRAVKKGDVAHSSIDYCVTKDVLGWEPQVALEEGVRRIFEWNTDPVRIQNAHDNTVLYTTLSPHQRCRHWLHGSY